MITLPQRNGDQSWPLHTDARTLLTIDSHWLPRTKDSYRIQGGVAIAGLEGEVPTKFKGVSIGHALH